MSALWLCVAVARRGMSGHHRPADWKPNSQIAKEHMAPMDFLPVPSGSWQEANAKLQSRFNMQLGASVAACIAVFGYVSKMSLY